MMTMSATNVCRYATDAMMWVASMTISTQSIATIHGVRLVPTGEHTGAIVAMSTTAVVLPISMIEVSTGANHVPMTLTSARIVITTMQMVVTHAQIIPMTMAIVLSTITLIDLMPSSIQPIRMSDCTLV